jgi:ribosome maturation factor RimP
MYANREEVENRVRESLEDVVKEMGFEIFDVKFAKGSRGWVLTIFIDKEDGYISIEDCEVVSKRIDPLLDEMNIIEHSYTLEVSSPGMDRPLRGIKDYIRFKGNLAKFVLKEFFSKRKVIVGYIQEYDEKKKTLFVEEKDTGQVFEVPVELISKSNLEIDF